MAITIQFFGQLAELTGFKTFEMEEVENTSQLKKFLAERFPVLKNRKFNIAVNEDIIDTDIPLSTGNIIALLPPYSGG
jgi:molybdopterin synthase sulfur carrier subunit